MTSGLRSTGQCTTVGGRAGRAVASLLAVTGMVWTVQPTVQTFATGGVCGHLAGQCATVGGRADCAVATLLAVVTMVWTVQPTVQTFATGGVCGHLAGQCATVGGRADCAVATLLAVTGQYSPLCRPLPQGVSVVTWLVSVLL